MSDIETTIEDAIQDAELPPDTSSDDTSSDLETSGDSTDVVESASETVEDAPESTNLEVGSPASKTDAAKPVDEFEKKFGIPAASSSGRENRIPYSRVKKIVTKAEKDAEARLSVAHKAALEPYETKVKDYEDRLTQVAEFEKVMSNDAPRFLQMLSQLPAYKGFFERINQLAQSAPNAPAADQPKPVDDMPQPDQALTDGTKVYSMEGLRALNDWNRAQARKEVIDEVSKRYAPIEQQWQAQQYMNQVIPQIQKQIDDARQWPMFKDNEDEITKALQANQNLSLEGAYRQIVYPKLVVDRNKMREDILKEVKQAPTSTSAPTQTSKPRSQALTSGPRDLESVIRESMGSLKG